MLNIDIITTIISAAIATGIMYLYTCIGEIIIEKAGNLNLGIPGIMSLGALGGTFGVNLYYKIFTNTNTFGLLLFSILFACVFASLGGLIYAFLCVNLQANQNVTGLVLTTFGVGFMKFMGAKINADRFSEAGKAIKKLFTFSDKLGFFGEIFFSYGFLVYFAFIIAILTEIFLKKTRTGLYLRAVGESPQTADAQGINVSKYKYLAIIVGSSIAGIGGLYCVMDYSVGTTFTNAPIEAYGWISVALVMFSMWKPKFGALGSILFGLLTILPNYLNIPITRLKLFDIMPYAATIIVLILTSIFDAKNSQPPSSLGVNYYREDR